MKLVLGKANAKLRELERVLEVKLWKIAKAGDI